MRVIIAGSRDLMPATRQDVFSWRMQCVAHAVQESGFDISVVISGGAEGIDTVGEAWAKQNSIPVERYPANWRKYAKAAGHIRNEEMAKVAQALICIWDGMSPGSRNMLETASRYGLRIRVFQPTD